MSMFDSYFPDPPLRRPVCGTRLTGWQGKDGPNALMSWRQGVGAPIDQDIDDGDVKLASDELAKVRLPEQFTIYAPCCGGRFFVEAICQCADGTWTSTELVTAETATQAGEERRDEFSDRLRWLGGNAG